MKCKQLCSGFELGLLGLFPMMITITPRAPLIYEKENTDFERTVFCLKIELVSTPFRSSGWLISYIDTLIRYIHMWKMIE